MRRLYETSHYCLDVSSPQSNCSTNSASARQTRYPPRKSLQLLSTHYFSEHPRLPAQYIRVLLLCGLLTQCDPEFTRFAFHRILRNVNLCTTVTWNVQLWCHPGCKSRAAKPVWRHREKRTVFNVWKKNRDG